MACNILTIIFWTTILVTLVTTDDNVIISSTNKATQTAEQQGETIQRITVMTNDAGDHCAVL